MFDNDEFYEKFDNFIRGFDFSRVREKRSIC